MACIGESLLVLTQLYTFTIIFIFLKNKMIHLELQVLQNYLYLILSRCSLNTEYPVDKMCAYYLWHLYDMGGGHAETITYRAIRGAAIQVPLPCCPVLHPRPRQRFFKNDFFGQRQLIIKILLMAPCKTPCGSSVWDRSLVGDGKRGRGCPSSMVPPTTQR